MVPNDLMRKNCRRKGESSHRERESRWRLARLWQSGQRKSLLSLVPSQRCDWDMFEVCSPCRLLNHRWFSAMICSTKHAPIKHGRLNCFSQMSRAGKKGSCYIQSTVWRRVSTHVWPHGRLASLPALISYFIEHMCANKISSIVNLCILDSNFPFICVIDVDIINPLEEVSK